MNSIAILGAGTWGMALAKMLKNTNKNVTVWSALPDEIEELSKTSRHPKLPNVLFPKGIEYTKDIKSAVENKDIIMFAVPSVFVRQTARKCKDYIKDNQIIVDVAKGIEPDTLFTLTQVIDDEIKNKTVKYVALSGPTHAEEVSRDMPTTIVSACQDIEVAKLVQEFFSSSFMRVYTNTDIKGIEICGALKNIIALATGISRGLGYGDNATAALVTRGLAELSRLGTAIGCSPYTFSGLTGMGDLIVTCTSIHSRNNNAGFLIGQGMSPDEAVKKVGMVVEGINAIPAALKLADKYNVDLPIIFAVNDIINGDVSPQYAVNSLFNRELKAEVELDFPKENY